MIVLNEAAETDPVNAAVLALVEAARASEQAYTPEDIRGIVEAAAVAEAELCSLEEAFFGSLEELTWVDPDSPEGKARRAADRHFNSRKPPIEGKAEPAEDAAEDIKEKQERLIEKARRIGISQERKDRWLKWIDEKIAHFREKAAAGGAAKGWNALVALLQGLRRAVSALPVRKAAAA